MQPQLYEVEHGNCPYLSERTWVTHSFQLESIPESVYEAMLADGWRRSGTSVYQNHCPGCGCCTPARVPVNQFRPSKSQRRTLRRNADVTVEVVAPAADAESFGLYQRYVRSRHTPAAHGTSADAPDASEAITPEQFDKFLVTSPVHTRAMRYHAENRLVGIGWIDVLPNGLSSVYFAFDPDENCRSLGTYSIMKEIELARDLGKEWLYLGFYVPNSPKMAYKGAFRPREFAVNGAWTRDEGEIVC
ncbi:MAG: arginyltransferase [Spirochaetales bacterium]|nr:arginyltransferase [Spirochaetales bacterium]